jgi:hypothetical protein
VLGLFVAPLAAAAGPQASTSSLLSSRWLWATVDVCTSASSADVVGIRGSMPGTGNADERMYMLFRLQYRDSAGGWDYVKKGGKSGSIYVGTSAYVSRQAGLNFRLSASTAAGTELRGEVYFDWRIAGRTEHHAVLTTTAGHLVTAGASPHGLSASHCTIG